ncbi:MAG: LysR family transcriptional regulator [Deltaproteobacteria bacterium]|nr:LysR family transcriptional regulator [Deltaproteobacteria bacterium]
MKLLAKIFLEDENLYALGPGRIALLRATAQFGSLNQAAQSVGMSYRWAWGRIKDSEKALGVKLLETKPAGRGHPRALTPEGLALLEWYANLENQVSKVLEQTVWPEFLNSGSDLQLETSNQPTDPPQLPTRE